MLQYITHQKIDFNKWDQCLDNCLNALPYAYSSYLNIVTQGKWDAIILDDYSAVFPIPFKNNIFNLKIIQPFFTQQLGLFYAKKEDALLLSECIEMMKRKFKRYYLHLNTENFLDSKMNRITYHLALNAPYERLKNNYGSAVKKNIKAAEKYQFKIENDLHVPQFILFVKKYLSDKTSDLHSKDYQILETLMKDQIRQKKGFLIAVKNDTDDLLSAAFILHSNKMLIYLVAMSSDEGRKKQSMTFLIDNLIQTYSGTETLLDFEGSMIPGIAHFYKSFAAQKKEFAVLTSS